MNCVKHEFILIHTFARELHKDVSQNDKIHKKIRNVNVEFKENFSNYMDASPSYHP